MYDSVIIQITLAIILKLFTVELFILTFGAIWDGFNKTKNNEIYVWYHC